MASSVCNDMLEVPLGEFAMTRLREEALRQHVRVEELAVHAIVYFLADSDSGRVAWKVPRSDRARHPRSGRRP